eukprot:CAMPEP_0179205354 /NCGR_PEP_ID=MMETSP0796-20121207/102376_1 /TAXON_ID=73915 /ORGANISM="Pyrodinium bahamense, Strain pbaha01" /LENGTH=189 /DNA_ID=CAMNT_0020910241 /DNA_START=65 /DNA_END=632 /DNA_ORIENTATION=+
MRRFAGDVEQGCGGEIELEPINGKEHAKPQPIAFAEPDVRAGFVRKVYGIIAMQLVLTTVIAGVLVHHGRQWLHSSPSVVLGVVTFSCVMSLVLACVFACCPETMRCSPLNYGLLALLTAAERLCLPPVHAWLSGPIAGLTAFVVVGLSAYAMWTKHDMTSFGPYLFCGLCVLCGTGLFLSMVAALGLT